ncbi:MAG: LysM peptidoglycan-binding domain-containing protein [Burkholderiales bacterium]
MTGMQGKSGQGAPRAAGTTAAAVIVFVALLAGCATPAKEEPPPPSPAAATPPPMPAKAAEPPPAPVPPPQPEVPPAVARQQAQKLALEAVDQLQAGDEAAGVQSVERALALDPGNEVARKMRDQIRADPQVELGAVYFRYTVQRDDTLAKLAQQYLGDRFRFYILAKYNNIAVPSRLSAGEAIKIPGRAPPVPAATSTPSVREAVEAGTRPATAETGARPRDETAELVAKGNALQRGGDLEGAYMAFVDAAQRAPGNAEAVKRRDASKVALVQRYDREATQAFQRQNLDLAISKWDRIIEIDPANRKARLERERALDLKRRLAEKFGQPK